MSEMETALTETQTRFYALETRPTPAPSQGEGSLDSNSNQSPLPSGGAGGGLYWSVDDGFNIKNLRVKQADKDGSLNYIASTYDPVDGIIRDGIYEGGRKVISFCGVLQQGVFPLPELLQLSQKFGAEEMRRPVEIELACNIRNGMLDFYLLQIRPIVDSKQVLEEDLQKIPDEDCLLRSYNSLGHGISEDVYDVVYVKTDDNFTAANNPQIATEIEYFNRKFLTRSAAPNDTSSDPQPSNSGGLGYILVGPGRWGSSDPWLGIPVKWPHISAARVIVETGLKNYHVDPSQGTHFFQNLTSFGVGYFTINTYTGDGIFRKELLDQMPAVEETEYVRHVRFDHPLKIMMDGKKQEGVVLFK